MTTVDLLDRTHSLVAVGGAIYAARQSGLCRISGGEAQNLYEAWLPNQDVPTLAIAVLPDGTLLGGINGGARPLGGRRAHLGGDTVPLATASRDLSS